MLADLKHEYPDHKIKYEPQPNCRACDGAGEHLNTYGDQVLCICTCVNFEDIGGIFKDFIARELKGLR